jgi:hypothetical protein
MPGFLYYSVAVFLKWQSDLALIAGDAPTLADLSAYCDIGQANRHGP